MSFFIKARPPGSKIWYFLTPKSTMNRLRVHAARVSDDNVTQMLVMLRGANREFEFKAVAVER